MITGIVGAEIRPEQHGELEEIANSLKVPFLIQPKRSSDRYNAFVKMLNEFHPDLIIVNSYSMLLPREILILPPHGAINIHGALLPEYRGANPIQWAILNNESITGVTMHYMTEQFDAGDIIAHRIVPMYFEDTWADIQKRIVIASEGMLKEEMPQILKGTNLRYAQDESRARHFHRRYPEDGLIDWEQSVLNIYNLIRALVKPNPGAFYFRNGLKEIIDDYCSIFRLSNMKYDRRGGQVLKSIYTELRPLTSNDLPMFFQWINNREQVLFNAPYKPVSEANHKEWFASIQQRNDIVIFGIWSIKDNRLIGSCQLKDINFIHRSAELQIRIGVVEMRGKGLGKDAISLLLKFAFDDLNLHRVFVQVFSTNHTAIRTYEGSGFAMEGKLREAAFIEGNYVDVLVMGVLRNEFKYRENSSDSST